MEKAERSADKTPPRPGDERSGVSRSGAACAVMGISHFLFGRRDIHVVQVLAPICLSWNRSCKAGELLDLADAGTSSSC